MAERCPHTTEVEGSIPSSPTKSKGEGTEAAGSSRQSSSVSEVEWRNPEHGRYLQRPQIMKLIIVRHGETQRNIDRIHQEAGTPLNETGRAQARALAGALRDYDIDTAYVSDYTRTRETAEEIVTFHPSMKIMHTPELRERNVGVFVGKPLEELTSFREVRGIPFYEFRPEGGESFVDVQERAVAFYKKIIGEHREGTVLLVTHRGVMSMLLLHLLGKTFDDDRSLIIGNTAITVLDIDGDDRHTFEILNSSKHLEEIG